MKPIHTHTFYRKININTIFQTTPEHWSNPFNSEKLSHPYKTRNIIVLQILIMFLDRIRFWTELNCSKQYPKLSPIKFFVHVILLFSFSNIWCLLHFCNIFVYKTISTFYMSTKAVHTDSSEALSLRISKGNRRNMKVFDVEVTNRRYGDQYGK
jgi:hypothetical protein